MILYKPEYWMEAIRVTVDNVKLKRISNENLSCLPSRLKQSVLEKLQISGFYNVTLSQVFALLNPYMTCIDLSNFEATDADLLKLIPFSKRLQSFAVNHCHGSPTVSGMCSFLSRCSVLRSASLTNFEESIDDVLAIIGNTLKNLQILDISGCKSFSICGIASISTLEMIEAMNLSRTCLDDQMTDKMITNSVGRSIKEFRCDDCANLTLLSIEALYYLPNLEFISFRRCSRVKA
ncbi:hypothetical protein QYM36_000190, partial [Artemia franciscana]